MKAIVAVAVLSAVVALATPGSAQRAVPDVPGVIAAPGQNRALAFQRWVAVAHTVDYLQQDHEVDNGVWRTRTSLFGINGTDRVADIGIYVLGRGNLYLRAYHQLDPGLEHRLLPGDSYFGGPNTADGDGEPPDYRGETIVVVSSEPVIVTGAVIRGFHSEVILSDSYGLAKSQSSRTLDVRQFDCTVPADFLKVAQFCRSLSPREQ